MIGERTKAHRKADVERLQKMCCWDVPLVVRDTGHAYTVSLDLSYCDPPVGEELLFTGRHEVVAAFIAGYCAAQQRPENPAPGEWRVPC